MTAESLLQILPVYLHGSQGPCLLPAEREVWERARHKEPCRLPEEGPGRLIRADFLMWLLTEERLKGLLPPSGLRIEGGRLVASVAEENPAPAPLIIPHATLHHTLEMEGTEIGGIYGPNAHTRTLRFIQCRFTGPILLQNATLHGELNLSRSTLQLSEREFYSIDLTESEVHGPLILRQTQCHAIYAQSLRVRGSVQASQVRTKGRLFLQAAQIEGDVILVEAQVGGVEVETPEASSGEEGGLSFADLRFVGPWQLAEAYSPLISGVPEYVGASLDGAHLQGHLDISRMHLGTGELSLREVHIGRDLRAAHARLDAINLSRAEIRGTADFSSIQLSNYSGPLQVDEYSKVRVGKHFAFPFKGRAMKVGEDVNLTGATIDGGIYLREARIQGNLLMEGIQLKREHDGVTDEEIIDLIERIEYEHIDRFEVKDAVPVGEYPEEDAYSDAKWREGLFPRITERLMRNLLSNRISGGVEQIWDIHLIYLRGVEVGGRLVMKGCKGVEGMNLADARVAVLEDAREVWPRAGRLNLTGLQVHTFADTAPNSPKDRLEWIRRQYPYGPPISPLEVLVGAVGVLSVLAMNTLFCTSKTLWICLFSLVLISPLLFNQIKFFYKNLQYMALSLHVYSLMSFGFIMYISFLLLAKFFLEDFSDSLLPGFLLTYLYYPLYHLGYLYIQQVSKHKRPSAFSEVILSGSFIIRFSFVDFSSLVLITLFYKDAYHISRKTSFPEWLWIVIGTFQLLVILYVIREYLRKGFVKLEVSEKITLRLPKTPESYWSYYFLLLAAFVPYFVLRLSQAPPKDYEGVSPVMLLGYLLVAWPVVITGVKYLEHRILRLWYQQEGCRYFTPYMPQMYDMVARFYQQRGQRADAIAMQIAREDDALFYGDVTGIQDVWRALLRYTTGYGYRLNLTLILAVLFLLAGTLTFMIAYQKGAIVPASVDVLINKPYVDSHVPPSDYPKFDPFMYAFDVFIPIIDLKMEPYYLPKRGVFWGDVAWVVMWIEIIGGWLLSTLFISAVANVIRREG